MGQLCAISVRVKRTTHKYLEIYVGNTKNLKGSRNQNIKRDFHKIVENNHNLKGSHNVKIYS